MIEFMVQLLKCKVILKLLKVYFILGTG